MAWSWTPVPRKLLRDHRILRLTREDRAVLLSLYLGVDEHGRFNADEMSLRCVLGLVDGEVLAESLERLCDQGLVHVWLHNGDPYGVIDGFDEDLGSDIRKRRPASTLPNPPEEVWNAARCDGLYKGGSHEPSTIRLPSGPGPVVERSPSGLNRGDRRKKGEETAPEQVHAGPNSSRQEQLAAQMALIQGAGSD